MTYFESAKVIEFATDALLFTKVISFINKIAAPCGKVGADVERVSNGMGPDGRIASGIDPCMANLRTIYTAEATQAAGS
ncbi:hypothetical protein [Sagittula sp. NFXS13]|uniref:hypothetical protein n=1 Tax=Sagittula sp. NFXS13 TaxID=2819095 RepID=UPI0032DF6401